MIKKQGSVRVDLTGGTIDLWPINLILSNVVTLNVATSLKAEVLLEEIGGDDILINSIDYKTENRFERKALTKENLNAGFFGNMRFVMEILNEWGVDKGVKLTLKSGSPAGAGLGGSSAMGVTIGSALCEYTGKKLSSQEIIKTVNQIEGRILNAGPPGYQDYYPALYGGILGLTPGMLEVEVHQLYSDELKKYLETHLTLVYSGQTRNSGINNWEVYKGFFDGVENARSGLEQIAAISHETFMNLKNHSYDNMAEKISEEGALRKKLFSGITTPEMDKLFDSLQKEIPSIGMKVCGAGGGGCFLLIHPEGQKGLIENQVKAANMTILDFLIEKPL